MKEDRKEKLTSLDTEHSIELSGENLHVIVQTALRNIAFWPLGCLGCGALFYFTFNRLGAFDPVLFKHSPYGDYTAFIYLGIWLVAGALLGYRIGILKISRYLIQEVKITHFIIRRIFSAIVTASVKLRTQKGELKDFSQLASSLSVEEADELLSKTLKDYRKKDFNWRSGGGLVKRIKKLILSRTKKFLMSDVEFFLLEEFSEEYHEQLGVGIHLFHVEERALHLLEEYLRERIAAQISRQPSVALGFSVLVSILFPLVINILKTVDIKYLVEAAPGSSRVRLLRAMLPHISIVFSLIAPLIVFMLALIFRRGGSRRKVA